MPPPPKKPVKSGFEQPTSSVSSSPSFGSSPVSERSEFKGLGSTKTPPRGSSRAITHEQIAKRAYEIYAGRGYAPGDQNADWLEAERQLKAGL